MPTASPSDSQEKKNRVMKERMGAWRSGDMHSGTGRKGEKGPVLKYNKRNYKQALAISLSMSGQSNRKSNRRSHRS